MRMRRSGGPGRLSPGIEGLECALWGEHRTKFWIRGVVGTGRRDKKQKKYRCIHTHRGLCSGDLWFMFVKRRDVDNILADDEEQFEKAIDSALEAGYRHIDAAFAYLNEHVVGRVLKKWFSSGKLSREDIFLTTKLPPCALQPENVEPFLRKSLNDLQVDYVDLYLVHVPFGVKYVEGNMYPTKEDGKSDLDFTIDHVATWKAMEDLVSAGLTKSIGVSNFNADQIGKILKNCTIPPCNLQIEHHAYLQQKDLVEFCKENKIVVTAYSPLGSPGLAKLGKETPDLMGHPVVNEIAETYNKSGAQVLLKHIVQKGIVAIPKSTNPERLRQNIDIFDFELSDADMSTLNDLDAHKRILDFQFLFQGVTEHPEYPFKECV